MFRAASAVPNAPTCTSHPPSVAGRSAGARVSTGAAPLPGEAGAGLELAGSGGLPEAVVDAAAVGTGPLRAGVSCTGVGAGAGGTDASAGDAAAGGGLPAPTVGAADGAA
jgi:hypothetical protein